MSGQTAVLWFRRDLRLDDNPALVAAAQGSRLICLYILDETTGLRGLGGAARWWLHHSLAALDAALRRRGQRLVLARGVAGAVLRRIAQQTGAAAIHAGSRPEPDILARDRALKHGFAADGLTLTFHPGALLFDPRAIVTASGAPFKVFTPFWRACRAAGGPSPPVPAPDRLPPPVDGMAGEALDDWGLCPTAPDWAAGFGQHWRPGEAGAQSRLGRFLDDGLDRYAARRDFPARAGSSRLSPHLAFGELSPRRLWQAVTAGPAAPTAAGDKFLAELGWREFSQHLLLRHPDLATANLRPEFDRFPWALDDAAFRAWTRGATGYPLVDAGMRELWATGWMHNRVRMVAASFLVKHLRQDWRRGEGWFWDTLVDADHASNAASWQWVAGSGADAAPYFRIFNPATQAERFDPDGTYIRRWCPEIGSPAYPAPIVDHKTARAAALAAFASLRGG